MTTRRNIKLKVISICKKMEVIKKVDAQPHMTRTKFVERLSVPVSTLNIIMPEKETAAMFNFSARQKK